MRLTEYKSKRNLSKTPEPSGGKSTSKKLAFVVQKHAASHLHYDFRLEVRDTLKSWAVPKGPSMDPKVQRLAMLVEDHPIDYKDFEGVIPPGNYGAGTVIIWDKGTYEPVGNFKSKAEQEKEMLRTFYGKKPLKIRLHGKKLKGIFNLIPAFDRGETSYLLIKQKDEFATKEDITFKDKSVVSKKTIEQIAASKKANKWISNRKSRASSEQAEKEKPSKRIAVDNGFLKDGGNEQAR